MLANERKRRIVDYLKLKRRATIEELLTLMDCSIIGKRKIFKTSSRWCRTYTRLIGRIKYFRKNFQKHSRKRRNRSKSIIEN